MLTNKDAVRRIDFMEPTEFFVIFTYESLTIPWGKALGNAQPSLTARRTPQQRVHVPNRTEGITGIESNKEIGKVASTNFTKWPPAWRLQFTVQDC